MPSLQRIALLCFLTAPLCAQSTTVEQLFPLHSGDTWSYSWTDAAGNTGSHDIEVVDTLYSSWYKVAGLPFGDTQARWYRRANTRLYQWRGYYATMFDSAASVGQIQSLSAIASELRNATIALADDDASITVPAGTWQGCYVYSIQTSSGLGLRSISLAPGAGLVEYTVSTAQGETHYTLKRADIDGAIYPKARGAHLLLTSDRLAYQTDASGNVSMRLSLEVATLGDPLTLHFTSGQRYDISVAPANNPGQPAWVWSANKLFTMATSSIDLVPGQPLVFQSSFDVPSLQSGDYIVRMQLVGSHRFAAESPISVNGAAANSWPAPSPAGSFVVFSDPDPANGWNVGDNGYLWTPLLTVSQGELTKGNGTFSAQGLPALSNDHYTLLQQAIVDIWDLALVWRYDDGSQGPEGTLTMGNAGNAGYFEFGTHTRAQDGLDYDTVRWRDIDDNSYTLYYLADGNGWALKARQYDN